MQITWDLSGEAPRTPMAAPTIHTLVNLMT